MQDLVGIILDNKKSVREIIDEAVLKEADVSVDLGTEDGVEQEEPLTGKAPSFRPDDEDYLQLFVRRYKDGAVEPTLKRRVKTAADALNIFFEWADRYKNERVEVWTTTKETAKKFYRYLQKKENLETLEKKWSACTRLTNKNKKRWNAARIEIKPYITNPNKAQEGTLYPFNAEV